MKLGTIDICKNVTFFPRLSINSYYIRERDQVWQQIATNLNGYPNFSVTLRAVRERFTTIMKKYKAQIGKEVQGTGFGGQEPTEYETLLEDLIERYEERELKLNKKCLIKNQSRKINKLP